MTTTTLTDPPKKTARRTPRPARPPKPPSTRPPSTLENVTSAVSTSLIMLMLVCVWAGAQMLLLGALSQERAQDLLYRDFRTQLAAATAPVGPIIPVGDPVAVLTIPHLGLRLVVVEGTASGDTLVGPGHRRDSPLPGQEGTSIVYGRSTTYGAPFGRITDLVPGEELHVVTGQGATTFRVLGVRRNGDPLPRPATAGHARLLLVTSEGNDSLRSATRDNSDTAVYVDAEATTALPAPPGRPATVPQSEEAMQSDPEAMPLLAFYMALLLALTLGVIAARQRWSTALVWVVASPLVLALSWASTDVVMRLLPNLI